MLEMVDDVAEISLLQNCLFWRWQCTHFLLAGGYMYTHDKFALAQTTVSSACLRAHHKEPRVHRRKTKRPQKPGRFRLRLRTTHWGYCLPPKILFLDPCSMKPANSSSSKWFRAFASCTCFSGPLEGCERSLSLASHSKTFPSPLTFSDWNNALTAPTLQHLAEVHACEFDARSSSVAEDRTVAMSQASSLPLLCFHGVQLGFLIWLYAK